MPQETLSGDGAYRRLGSWFSDRGVRSVLLVCGEKSYRAVAAGVAEAVSGLEVERLSGFSPNPQRETLDTMLAERSPTGHDAILAVGGGTAIDYAKLLKFSGGEGGEPALLPIVAVPTTSGSGAEATHFAVLYEGFEKQSVAHPSLKPEVVVLDPGALAHLPGPVFAASLLDALCQSIESYWSIRSTEGSRALAGEAMRTLWRWLPEVHSRRTADGLAAVMRASNLAGGAIDITRTTAPHAVSYPLTSRFGITHGFAVAVTMPEFLVFNADTRGGRLLDPRGREFVDRRMAEIFEVMGAASPEAARDSFVGLLAGLDALVDLAGAGIGRGDIEFVLRYGFNPERVNNNPRHLEREDLRAILQRCLRR